MTRRRWLFFITGVTIIVLATSFILHSGWRTVAVVDPNVPQVLSLSSQPNDGWPAGVSGISIWVTGEIDGEAEIWASNWTPQRLSGRINWRVYHDWFGPDCLLHYQPLGPVSGRLEIRYQFH